MRSQGFTIIEVSIASFLLIVLGVGILGLQQIIGDFQLTSFSSFVTVEGGSEAINTMARELRKAQSGENGAYALVVADDNLITFYSDVDFDDQAEQVSYFVQGTDLVRSVVEPTGQPPAYSDPPRTNILTQNLKNEDTPVFFYFNDGWPTDTENNPLPTPASLSQVSMVQMVVVVNASSDAKEQLQLDSFVHLRTLKDNL